jgi:hypothetical protein
LPFAERDGLFLGIEGYLYFLLHVGRAGPAHERFDRSRLFGLVVEHPFLGLGLAGLHGRAGRLVNAGGHRQSIPKRRQNSPTAKTFNSPRLSIRRSEAKAHGRGSRIGTCVKVTEIPQSNSNNKGRGAAKPGGAILIRRMR